MSEYDAETPRLFLERLSMKHLEDFHTIWSSKESMIWSSRVPNSDTEQSREWIRQNLTSVNPNIDKYGIMLKPDPTIEGEAETLKLIGLVGTIRECDEMAYMLHVDYWGKGYMTEALKAFAGPEGVFWILDHRKGIQRLVAQIDLENEASMKLIAKIGARRGEVTRKKYGLGRDKEPDGVVPEVKMRDTVAWYVDRPVGR